ncbi:MAG: hydantoinase/oxoprolinase family protein [Sphingomonadales bacterium]|nr:hydantoinase/oxoprolinase family protein [Sphingomonadales bacterium]
MKRYALGIDIGGTFTDIVVYDAAKGRQFSRKELTTHADPSVGVMTGIDRLLTEDDVAAAEVGRVVHATTLFANALIERRGAVTGLITTQGFRDTLEIGRERKYELYDIKITKPRPLVPRHLRLEVPERLNADGSVHHALDETALLDAASRLVDRGATSLAITFLHAYANPVHERRALELLERRFPHLALSASIDVAPEIREYERTSTTVCNAYVKPLAERYLSTLVDRIATRGIAAPLLMMLSNGGLTNIEEAKRTPVQLLESGPAAGALVAAHFGAMDGGAHVLAFDMGGTTAKLSVIDDGKPKVARTFEAGREKRFIAGSGLPIHISTVELIEIGAGGGSIAHVDAIGLMKVGPISAGSEPGPASYGRGGTSPTVTDADFVLGYLDPGFFAGGTMQIDIQAAERAFAQLAEATGLDRTALAWGIHDIVNENMANAARVHIAEHGKDPRIYTLLSTGGAGPVHAYYVARKLGLATLIAPCAAGVASALGLLIAPARVDRVATVARELAQLDWADIEATFTRLEADARQVLDKTQLPSTDAHFQRMADIRYVGQASELVVPLPSGPFFASSEAAIKAAFEQCYVAAFTRTPPASPLEIINVRVTVTLDVPGSARSMQTATDAGDPIKGIRPAYFPEFGTHVPTTIYDRYRLVPGNAFNGPAIVEERESTLIVGPRGRFKVAASGNIIVTVA